MKNIEFNPSELAGAFGDLGTLIPLSLGLVFVSDIPPAILFGAVGVFYILTGLYYGLPVPVQPLKAVSVLAITLGLGREHLMAAGLIIGALMILLSLSGVLKWLKSLFFRSLVRGIQITVGVLLFWKGFEFAFLEDVFFRQSIEIASHIGLFTALGALVFIFGLSKMEKIPTTVVVLAVGFLFGYYLHGFQIPVSKFTGSAWSFPSLNTFLNAFVVLVIPQIPVTLGNAVYGSSDLCKRYYGKKASRVSPSALGTSIGLFDLTAGILGGMPVCHGSGGVAAHHKFGGRTGGTPVILGAVLLTAAFLAGSLFPGLFLILPKPVLGILLLLNGLKMLELVFDLSNVREFSVVASITSVSIITGNTVFGMGAGIALKLLGERFIWTQTG